MNLFKFFQKMVALLEPGYSDNESSILGKYLTANHIYVLRNLVKKYDVQVAGSIALVYSGLLQRQVGDIDLIVSKSTLKQILRDSSLELSYKKHSIRIDFSPYGPISTQKREYEIFESLDGKSITRMGLNHPKTGVKVCLFVLDRMPQNPSYHRFLDMDLTISPVNEAIRAKVAYAIHNEKHKVDLENINNILENAFFLATNKPL
jgi:hypothetical protein